MTGLFTGRSLTSRFINGVLLGMVLCGLSPSLSAANWWDKLFEKDKKDSPASALSSTEISGAFKEALSLGVDKVAAQLASPDGFNADELIHIPLPKEFKSARKILAKVGYADQLDELELKLNRAAEAATPEAKALFLKAIEEMTFDDVEAIYRGKEDAVTEYFRQKMSPQLSKVMQPVIENSLSEVGALQLYDQVISKYRDIPFVPDLKADLTGHVIERGLAGLFHYIAIEEAAIRKDPVKQTTELLKKVFQQ